MNSVRQYILEFFSPRKEADTEALKDYWEHPKKYIGKMLTVAFQGLSADGIPRFPVALRLAESL